MGQQLIKQRKYIDACMHYMALSSISRKAAYLYPPDLAENLFSLASDYESLTINIRNKERGGDIHKLVKLKDGSITDCLFFPEKTSETWDHIGGLEDPKMKIREMSKSSRAFFIYGPRGSGKKTLVRAFARSREIGFYEVHTYDLLTKYFGDPREVIDALFDKGYLENK